MSVQERSETKNGAKMEPTWHQNGSQNGSKIDPKIWWIFWSILKRSWSHLPRENRQQLSEPEPWRGGGGRHKSLPPRVWRISGFDWWISSCSTRREAKCLGGFSFTHKILFCSHNSWFMGRIIRSHRQVAQKQRQEKHRQPERHMCVYICIWGCPFLPLLSPDIGKRGKIQGIIARRGQSPDVRLEFLRMFSIYQWFLVFY